MPHKQTPAVPRAGSWEVRSHGIGCLGRLGAGGPAGATLQVPGSGQGAAVGRVHPTGAPGTTQGAGTCGQGPLGVTQNSVLLALRQLSAGMPGTPRRRR